MELGQDFIVYLARRVGDAESKREREGEEEGKDRERETKLTRWQPWSFEVWRILNS